MLESQWIPRCKKLLAPMGEGRGNQGTLHDDVRTFLDDPETELSVSNSTVDGDHGRIETRTSMVSTDIAWLQADDDWPGLTAAGSARWLTRPPRRPPTIC